MTERLKTKGLKPYPEYKESGVPWLGKVPADWEVQRGKCLFQNRKELNINRSNKNVLSLTLRGVVNNDPSNPEGLVPKDYATYQLFRKGDLVFKLIDLENLRTSRVGLVHEDGIMSSAYVRLIPQNGGNIRFFFHQYFDLYSRGVYNKIGAGVRSTLGANDLLNIGILLPSNEEQDAIVRFIDHENGRIERVIQTKKKLIVLLNEQKQAIIHRVVTSGLDPTVPLKPSGEEWLGKIPENWEVRKLSSVCSLIVDGTHFSPKSDSIGDFLYITAKNIKEYGVEVANASYVSAADHSVIYNRCPVVKGDVLYIKDGATAGLATVNALDDEFSILSSVALIRPKPDALRSEYLSLSLNESVFKEHVLSKVVGGAMTRFTMAIIKRFAICVPPIAEQDMILQSVNAQIGPFRAIRKRVEREIALLREYRTRLVADVVTGKLDVREGAKNLPAEAEEPPIEFEPEEQIEDEVTTMDE